MIKNSFSHKFDVKIDDVGFDKNIFPKKLMEEMQIIATLSADELGFGYGALRPNNLAWTINRIKVELLSDIGVGELEFTTWPLAPKHFTCDRDFFALNAKGERVLQAISSWNVFDLKERSLCSTKAIAQLDKSYSEERAMQDINYQRVVLDKSYDYICSHTVMLSDLDVNDHVNNTHYINYAVNCLTKEEYLKKIACFEIKFQRELKLGQTLKLFLKREEKKRFIVGKREEDVVFSACIYLKND